MKQPAAQKNNNLIGIAGTIKSGKSTVGKIIQYLTKCPTDFTTQEFINRYINSYPINIEHDWQIKKFADKLKDIVCLLIGCTREEIEDHNFKNEPLGYSWSRFKVTYSDGYDEVVDIFPIDFDFDTLLDAKGNIAYIHSKEIITYTPRLLLQIIGTDLFKNQLHPNIWVSSLFSGYRFQGCKNDGDSCETPNGDCDSIHCYPKWIIDDIRFPDELKAVKDRGGISIKVERNTELRYPEVYKLFEDSNSEEWEWEEFLKSIGLYNTIYHESETQVSSMECDYVIKNNGSLEDLIDQVKDILIKEGIL